VQETDVVVAESTGQSIPSMIIEYNEVSVGKLVPVKVTGVPPTTVPNLGETAERVVVKAP
jgi:hypothetical protein